MDRTEALALIKENVKDVTLYKHILAVEAIMRGLAKELGDQASESGVHNALGEIFFRQGQFQNALFHFEKSLLIEEQLGNLVGKATILNNIAFVYNVQGDYTKALTCLENALALYNQVGLAHTYNAISTRRMYEDIKRRYRT